MAERSNLVICCGISEWLYFDSIRRVYNIPLSIEPSLPCTKNIKEIICLAKKAQCEQYDSLFLPVNMYDLYASDEDFKLYKDFKNASQSQNRMLWIENSPCIELWYLSHFLSIHNLKKIATKEEALFLFNNFKSNIPACFLRSQHGVYDYLLQNQDNYSAEKKCHILCNERKKVAEDPEQFPYSEMGKFFRLINI